MGRYFDRSGRPLTLEEWAETFKPAKGEEGPEPSRHVGYDLVPDHLGREHLVSTVWLGLDHGYGEGPPLIFETMVFCHHDGDCELNEAQWRYSTEEQASVGHATAIALVSESTNSQQRPQE